MKKWIMMLLAIGMLVSLCACGSKQDAAGSADALVIEYGESERYSPEELEDAAALILKEFDGWKGCEMDTLRYAGDDATDAETVEWLNKLDGADPANPFTECAEFISDFHTATDTEPGFNPDGNYTDWQWYVARTENGDWALMSWGY